MSGRYLLSELDPTAPIRLFQGALAAVVGGSASRWAADPALGMDLGDEGLEQQTAGPFAVSSPWWWWSVRQMCSLWRPEDAERAKPVWLEGQCQDRIRLSLAGRTSRDLKGGGR